MNSDWGQRIPDVVDGWLFSELGDLPASLLVPLENPHLHDGAAWERAVGPPSRLNGVVACHSVAGQEIGVAKPVLGAAATAMLIDAASRRGVRTVVGVGFCGGTDPRLQCGDVIVASSAHARDGVSQAYDPDVASTAGDGRLLALARDRARIGDVLSVAAVHLEDQALVDHCARSGVLGVDLETASLYTVSRLRGLAAVAVLAVSDVPARCAAADATLLAEGAARALELGVFISLAAGQPHD